MVARRADRISALAAEIGGTPADVTDGAAVEALAERVDRVGDVLVNNAGGAKGLGAGRRGEPRPLALDVGDQRAGHAAGHPGVAARPDRVGRRPDRDRDVDRGVGTYDGGSGYTAAKSTRRGAAPHAAGELLGKPVRLTEIAPGAVETEFSWCGSAVTSIARTPSAGITR